MSNNDTVTYTRAADESQKYINACDLPFEYDIKEAVERLYQRRNELLDENAKLRFQIKICMVPLILGAIHGLSFFIS